MSLQSLIASGTKVWLDGVEPNDVKKNRALGITGATSNPIIISDIIKSGHFDGRITDLVEQGLDDDAIAWMLDDELVKSAQQVFLPVWEQARGNDGYVSFELDPLLEDVQKPIPHAERVRKYIELGKKWSAGHKNRMIKVPATPAGLDALEELAAAGVTINVTLIFSQRQYKIARDNVWRGAQRRKNGLNDFKSVYSIFVSRLDVYTEKQVPDLNPAAQGQVGIVNVKRIWRLNQEFWKDKNLRLQQEIVFASTGVKKPTDPPDKYVEALAGSDIQTNPPATNEAVQKLNKRYTKKIDQMPPEQVLREIDQKVDPDKMERVLMEEGIKKFADPQHALLKLIAEKRAQLAPAK
ncbi:MAG TPA: transaldolase family protein [Tepidisphaeraceae bacterium]|jgi:transaldolase|nr:transaldolase family protein [Tepidisphaeraceae bacterium]